MRIAALLCLLSLVACNIRPFQSHRSTKSIESADTGYYSDRSCVFVEKKESFEITILAYSPCTTGCGVMEFASNCVGRCNNGDTIRILSLCNEDNTFSGGEKIRVMPENWQHGNLHSISYSYYYDNADHDGIPHISYLFRKKLNTIWGSIAHLK